MKQALLGTGLYAAVMMVVVSQAISQPPAKEGKGGEKGAKKYELGQIFPPPLHADLKLTREQEVELDLLTKDLKNKLEKLLTNEQKKAIANHRPPGQGGPSGPAGKGSERTDVLSIDPNVGAEGGGRLIV